LSNDDIKKIRFVGDSLQGKADDLQDLVQAAPDVIRKFRGIGDYYKYVADEYERLQDQEGIFLGIPQSTFDDVDAVLSLELPSVDQLALATRAATASTTSISIPLVDLSHERPELHILNDPPQRFRSLRETSDIKGKLNELKQGLGNSWKNASNSIEVSGVDSVKNSASNARTVVDELSWLTPYDIISKLTWCEFDDKKRPTRASRYAWIMYGEDGPSTKPAEDPAWKPLNDAYKRLNKYVHITSIVEADISYMQSLLITIQDSLEEYLRRGFNRLKSMA